MPATVREVNVNEIEEERNAAVDSEEPPRAVPSRDPRSATPRSPVERHEEEQQRRRILVGDQEGEELAGSETELGRHRGWSRQDDERGGERETEDDERAWRRRRRARRYPRSMTANQGTSG